MYVYTHMCVCVWNSYFLVDGVELKDQNHHPPCKDATLKQHPCKNL